MTSPAGAPTRVEARRQAAPTLRDAGRGGYVGGRLDDAARYQVDLVDGAGDELAFVRALRTIARLSLAEALEIHAYAARATTATVVAGVRFATASQLACALGAAGIAAKVVPSSVATPMVCRPHADEIRTWTIPVAGRTRPTP